MKRLEIIAHQAARLIKIYASMPQTDEFWEKRMRVLSLLSNLYWEKTKLLNDTNN